jgi:hypothetical protein
MSYISSHFSKVQRFHLLLMAGMFLIFSSGCKKESSSAAYQKPTVKLIAPIGTTHIYTSDSLLIKAEASDADGSISCVYFYVDNKLVFTDYSTPYDYWAKNFSAGNHTVGIIAADNHQLLSNLASSSVEVMSLGVFNVWLTYSPGNDYYNIPEGDSIVFEAIASSPFGRVTDVKLFMNSQLFGEGAKDTCFFTWNPTIKGNWVIQAIAYDEKNNVAKSSAMNMTIAQNQPPTASFWEPLPDYVIFNPWDSVEFSIEANDPENLMKRVELYANNVLIKTITSPDQTGFYEFAWKNIPPGSYDMVAKAIDRQGAIGVSPTLTITIQSGFKTDGAIPDIISSEMPNLVFAINSTDKKLLFLNPVDKILTGSINLPYNQPVAVDYSASDKKLYVVYQFEGKVTIYNNATQQLSWFSFSPDIGATDVKVDAVNRVLYVIGTNGTLFMINQDNGSILNTIPTFTGDHLSIFAPGHLLFSEQTSGNYVTLYKFSIATTTPQLLQQKQVGYSASQVLVDPTGTIVVVPTGNFTKSNEYVYAYDVTNLNHILGQWDFGTWPHRVAFNPDGQTLSGVNSDYYDDYIYVNDVNTFATKNKLYFRKGTEDGIVSPNSDGTKLIGITNNGATPPISYVYFYNQ